MALSFPDGECRIPGTEGKKHDAGQKGEKTGAGDAIRETRMVKGMKKLQNSVFSLSFGF
jgi:hypothetical protein